MKTKDFGLASLLLCKGHKIIKHTRDEFGQVWFEFKDNEKTGQHEYDFYTNEATVHVQDYINAQRRIKSLIFKPHGNEYGKRNKNSLSVSQ